MKTLVLGLGNPILSDDAVGIRIARELRKRVDGVDVEEGAVAGITILDHIQGYDSLVIVDSIKTGKSPPGHLHVLRPEDLDCVTRPSRSHHGLGLVRALSIGKRMGYDLPDTIRIYAVEVLRNDEFGEDLSPQVEESVPAVVEAIASYLTERQ
ncbi:hydrogenase maturation protease [Candidatus Fermentibacteria bacterium]|nr:hydrogenase maturation protease [Candidatus Fermentibacteria bacterium]